MTEDLRNLWTLSAPVTSEYNSAMQDFTGLTYATSPQHKESSEARIKRDAFDMEKIRQKLASLLIVLLRNHQRHSSWVRCECT